MARVSLCTCGDRQSTCRPGRPGLIVPLPALTPATPQAVREAEAVIGHKLPRLLRRLYLEVGNGGFGPGYGVLGLSGGHRVGGQTALDLYRQATPTSWRSVLPAGLLPLCAWGCAIFSFTDCSHPDGRMWAWDPNGGPAGREALFDQAVKLGDWLDRWVAGKLYQPTAIQDAATGQWRGATNAEIEAMMPPRSRIRRRYPTTGCDGRERSVPDSCQHEQPRKVRSGH
jgi:hypothetical protein